jgi:gliding motility-associated lipoprotein GldD
MFRYLTLAFLAFIAFSCADFSPRPRGYFRIETPEPTYKKHWEKENYGFDLSEFAEVKHRQENWLNIVYPFYKGQINSTYKTVNGNFQELAEDSRNFVYKHSIKADAITEQFFENPENRVYGMLYELKGNTASPIQFVLTDSATYLFRGALYFDATPNKDSIAPVVDYIKQDIIRLMETFEHK